MTRSKNSTQLTSSRLLRQIERVSKTDSPSVFRRF